MRKKGKAMGPSTSAESGTPRILVYPPDCAFQGGNSFHLSSPVELLVSPLSVWIKERLLLRLEIDPTSQKTVSSLSRQTGCGMGCLGFREVGWDAAKKRLLIAPSSPERWLSRGMGRQEVGHSSWGHPLMVQSLGEGLGLF